MTRILDLGAKLNGWLKVIALAAALVAGWVSLSADVKQTAKDIQRVEGQAKDAREDIERRNVESLRDINRKLDEIYKYLLENR